MSTQDKNEAQRQTEASKQQATEEAKNGATGKAEKDETIHTINPFTGAQTDITPEDLEGMEKLNEANTERD